MRPGARLALPADLRGRAHRLAELSSCLAAGSRCHAGDGHVAPGPRETPKSGPDQRPRERLAVSSTVPGVSAFAAVVKPTTQEASANTRVLSGDSTEEKEARVGLLCSPGGPEGTPVMIRLGHACLAEKVHQERS